MVSQNPISQIIFLKWRSNFKGGCLTLCDFLSFRRFFLKISYTEGAADSKNLDFFAWRHVDLPHLQKSSWLLFCVMVLWNIWCHLFGDNLAIVFSMVRKYSRNRPLGVSGYIKPVLALQKKTHKRERWQSLSKKAHGVEKEKNSILRPS